MYTHEECYRHLSDVSVDFIKDKMANWEVIVLESLAGLLEFSRVLGNNKDLVANRVITVSITSEHSSTST